jgi:oligopeptide/dipeptide ABC transporter ATP-binding protein
MSLLKIHQLRVHLNTPGGIARAVDGVDLEIHPGEAVGLVGESGSGKSVLALSVLGLQPQGPEVLREGSSIQLQGEELVGLGNKELRAFRGGDVAMVFQEPMTSLNPVLTVGRQIGEAVGRRGEVMGADEIRGRVEGLLEEVGLPDPQRQADAYPHQLSGGMRQRVMIAMALAGDPALLVADEPTTALDVTVQAQILDLLRGLQRDRSMALLLISHDLRMVANLCQRVLVMYGGRVVEEGATAEVMAGPRHPYTRGLLGARLSIHDRRRGLRPIQGGVPEASAWPSGCRFHPRCPDADDRCGNEEPEMVAALAGTGVARCWFPKGEGADE